MRTFLLISLCFLVYNSALEAQNLIGMSPEKVKSYFTREESDMVIDSSFRNENYNYLKFVDEGSSMITKLVFFDKDKKCSFVRAIYDKSLESEVREELDRKYKRESDSIWIDKRLKQTSRIEYLENEWFISVEFKPYK